MSDEPKPRPQDDPEPADTVASGMIDDPIQPGETQPGESMEQAQLRGGPIDIAPERLRKR